MVKHSTYSKEALELEKDPDYVTKEIIVENGVKTAVFEKITKDEVIEKEGKKNDKK